MLAGRMVKGHLSTMMCCFLSAVPASHLHSMALAESSAFRVTHREQQLLESKACQDTFNVGADKIVASGMQSSHDEIYAEVLCRSHDNFKLNSVHHVVFCEKHRSSWKCPRSELAIRMSDSSHALIYFEDDIATEIAYNIVMKLAASKYFQGEDIPNPQQSVCNIQHHYNDDHTLVADVYVATCGKQEVFISTWCPQEECPRIIGTRNWVLD